MKRDVTSECLDHALALQEHRKDVATKLKSIMASFIGSLPPEDLETFMQAIMLIYPEGKIER